MDWDDDYDYYNDGYYGYDDGWGGRGGRQNRSEEVTFYRPDGDTEGKDIGWCLDNGFHEIEEGLWSGDWYYRHHPEYKKEKEAARKAKEAERKKISPEEAHENAMKKWRKNRKAELLDEIYNGGYHPNHRMYDAARKELNALIDEEKPAAKRQKTASMLRSDYCCPIPGCRTFFSTKDKMEEHVKKQTGKAHDRHRMEHGIPFLGYKPEPFPPMVAPPAPPPPLPSNQTDIRSFFQPTTKNEPLKPYD